MKEFMFIFVGLMALIVSNEASAHSGNEIEWKCDYVKACLSRVKPCQLDDYVRIERDEDSRVGGYKFQAVAKWNSRETTTERCFNSLGNTWSRVRISDGPTSVRSDWYKVHGKLGPGRKVDPDLLKLAQEEAMRKCEQSREESQGYYREQCSAN